MGEVDAETRAEEQRRLRELRAAVDLAAQVLMQGGLGPVEAARLLGATRARALELFPDKASTYDLVLAPRLARLVDEFVAPDAGPAGGPSRGRPRARVLPFVRRRPRGAGGGGPTGGRRRARPR